MTLIAFQKVFKKPTLMELVASDVNRKGLFQFYISFPSSFCCSLIIMMGGEYTLHRSTILSSYQGSRYSVNTRSVDLTESYVTENQLSWLRRTKRRAGSAMSILYIVQIVVGLIVLIDAVVSFLSFHIFSTFGLSCTYLCIYLSICVGALVKDALVSLSSVIAECFSGFLRVLVPCYGSCRTLSSLRRRATALAILPTNIFCSRHAKESWSGGCWPTPWQYRRCSSCRCE